MIDFVFMAKFLCVFLLFSTLVFAGEKDGGGGDPGKISQQLSVEKSAAAVHALIWFLAHGPSDGQPRYAFHLSQIISSINPDYIFNEEAKIIFLDMLNRGLVQNVSKTPIKLQDKCIIYRSNVPFEVTTGTLMDTPGSEVCVNPYRFIDSIGGTLKESLFLGFMLHEYAHHYGYLDLDHSFGAAMAEAIELSINKSSDPDLLDYYFRQTRYMHQTDKSVPYVQEWNRCVQARDCFTSKEVSGVTIITH